MNNKLDLKLRTARTIILEHLSSSIKSTVLRSLHNDLKIIFYDERILYLTFNNSGEYSYQLLFSENKLDRVRFDNFDKEWDVESKPNHFHPRFTKSAFKSPMNGNIKHDIRILCQLLQSKSLMNSNHRF